MQGARELDQTRPQPVASVHYHAGYTAAASLDRAAALNIFKGVEQKSALQSVAARDTSRRLEELSTNASLAPVAAPPPEGPRSLTRLR